MCKAHTSQTVALVFLLVYNGTAIGFDVTGDNGTSGFCRIHIPKVFIYGPFQVFANGTETAYTLLQFSNEIIAYLYFNYTHSTEQVTIIPDFSQFHIVPAFMLATLSAVAALKRNRFRFLRR